MGQSVPLSRRRESPGRPYESRRCNRARHLRCFSDGRLTENKEENHETVELDGLRGFGPCPRNCLWHCDASYDCEGSIAATCDAIGNSSGCVQSSLSNGRTALQSPQAGAWVFQTNSGPCAGNVLNISVCLFETIVVLQSELYKRRLLLSKLP